MQTGSDHSRHESAQSVLTTVAVVLIVMGIGLLAFGSWKLVDGLATRGWTGTQATVTGAEVVRTVNELGKAPQREYRVTMDYTVETQSYTLTFRTRPQLVEPRIGSTQPVRYDPANPTDTRRGSGSADVIAGPILGVLGIALATGGVALFRRSRRGPVVLPGFRATQSIGKRIDLGGNGEREWTGHEMGNRERE